jgi:hypothetical protein
MSIAKPGLRRAVCGFTGAGLLAHAAAAQSAPPPAPQASPPVRTAIVSGVVTNLNGVPLPHTEVLIVNTPLRTFTNDSGVFEFLAAPPGRVRLVARRVGFQPEEQRATLEAGRLRQVDFELKGIPEQLDSVMVREAGGRGRMADFWARRMVGVGAFLTHEDIARRKPQRSSDLLRTVTGVRVSMGETGLDRPVISMGRNQITDRNVRGQVSLGACNVSYYVDGSFVPPGTFHMDDISPLLLEAVEVYRGPAETPARLRQRDTACGVIVLWTRNPSRDDGSRKPPGDRE